MQNKIKDLENLYKNLHSHNFIIFSKSPTDTSILFSEKPNNSLCLYIDYQDFHNLTIKNHYSLLLINKSLDLCSWTQLFT